ncbi:MAG: ABC transporter permease [Alphaproteobacteria bacterium]|nr:ABC transporter permease [Alphaproteobacteria bacterium]
MQYASVNHDFSGRRVLAIVLRHLYLLRGSWIRIAEMAYWPTINVIMWGYLSVFLRTNSTWVARAAGVLLGAVLLWDVLFRANLGMSLSFLEEMWSRNLANLFVTPLRPIELMAGLTVMSLIRTIIGVLPAMLLAIVLYQFNIFELGLPLIAFFINLLVTGWAVGLGVSALVLRFGMGAESLAWVLIFALAPISGIYYPIAVMPEWLQVVAWLLPPAHVFEGMRAVMFDHVFPLGHFAAAVGLNLLYFSAAAVLFHRVFYIARQRGLLMNLGE